MKKKLFKEIASFHRFEIGSIATSVAAPLMKMVEKRGALLPGGALGIIERRAVGVASSIAATTAWKSIR